MPDRRRCVSDTSSIRIRCLASHSQLPDTFVCFHTAVFNNTYKNEAITHQTILIAQQNSALVRPSLPRNEEFVSGVRIDTVALISVGYNTWNRTYFLTTVTSVWGQTYTYTAGGSYTHYANDTHHTGTTSWAAIHIVFEI